MGKVQGIIVAFRRLELVRRRRFGRARAPLCAETVEADALGEDIVLVDAHVLAQVIVPAEVLPAPRIWALVG